MEYNVEYKTFDPIRTCVIRG